MAPRGLGTVVVAGATAACAILMLGGVGPAADPLLAGEPLPGVADPTAPTDDEPPDDEPPDGPDDTTTTTSSATATTTTTTTTTTYSPAPPPIPLSVSASQDIVGAGGLVTFDGTCPVVDGVPLGPVVLWVIGDSTEIVATAMLAEAWSYTWTAPTDPDRFGSFAFQFWCGDPSGHVGGYPASLQRVVDMVAQAPPPVALPVVESESPLPIIPATD